jgi:Transposase DDE domain
MLILRGHKFSLQNALNKVFGALGKLRLAPTASAYCQARQKLDPALFQELTTTTAQDFYRLAGQEGSVATWRGHRLLGADGSFLTLPDTPELRNAYSVQRNPITGTQTVQALSVVLYDLRNDLALGAKLGPIVAEKQYLFDLWEQTQRGDVLVLDRLFADYCVIAYAAHSRRDVLIRCPRQSFGVVRDFWSSELREQIIDLPCPQTPSTRAFVKEHKLPLKVRVRLLKFTLPTGETEVLLTTLCDKQQYPASEFYQVYGWRWGNETYYDRLKNIFEVERFSGTSQHVIEQDFYAIVFLTTLESVLTKSAQATLQERDQQRQNQTEAKVNRALSYVNLCDRVVELLADPRSDLETVRDELHRLFQQTPTRHPPGRQYPRKKRAHSMKLRYIKYFKRIIA